MNRKAGTDPMKLTKQAIDALKSKNGGFSREIAAALGVPWPLATGWKEKLIAAGKEISDDEFARLLALKDAHLKN
jgi:hypothetical protein